MPYALAMPGGFPFTSWESCHHARPQHRARTRLDLHWGGLAPSMRFARFPYSRGSAFPCFGRGEWVDAVLTQTLGGIARINLPRAEAALRRADAPSAASR